jgi:phage repressor protein C with HTH and peptisase S24 domain
MVDAARAERLRQARRAAGYDRPVDALRAFGWNRSTYFCHENATRGISRDKIMVYADAFRVERDWLAFGRGPIRRRGSRTIPIEGYVGRDATIEERDRQADQTVDETELPEGISPEYFVAYRVRGDTNFPVWRDRDVLLVPRDHGPPEDYLGKVCVITPRNPGRRLIRTLMAGSRAGVFTLFSHAVPPMIDVEILEAAPIAWTKHDS